MSTGSEDGFEFNSVSLPGDFSELLSAELAVEFGISSATLIFDFNSLKNRGGLSVLLAGLTLVCFNLSKNDFL